MDITLIPCLGLISWKLYGNYRLPAAANEPYPWLTQMTTQWWLLPVQWILVPMSKVPTAKFYFLMTLGTLRCIPHSLNCCWPLPTQWFLVLNPMRLITSCYCLIAIGAFKVKVILQLVVSQFRHPSGNRDQIFYFFCKIILRQLQVCWCGPPSLMRGQDCSLQLLLDQASTVFLRSEYGRTHEHICTVSNLRLPQPVGPCSFIYFPQEHGSPVQPPAIELV
jgi:hypothetical protein